MKNKVMALIMAMSLICSLAACSSNSSDEIIIDPSKIEDIASDIVSNIDNKNGVTNEILTEDINDITSTNENNSDSEQDEALVSEQEANREAAQEKLYYCGIPGCPGHIIGFISSSDELPSCEPIPEDDTDDIISDFNTNTSETSEASETDTDNIVEVAETNEIEDIPVENNTDSSVENITPENNFEAEFSINLSIAGDCMLSTYKGERYSGSFSDYAATREPTYFLEKVVDIFNSDDFTIVNLENVLTDSNLSPVSKDHSPAYWYKGPTSNTNILTSSSVEVVSLANNHVGDYGNQGRKDTIDAVVDAGLLYGNNDVTTYIEKNGFKIAIICHGLWSEWQASQIIPRIEEASKQSDYQIVFYHGGTERLHAPEEWKKRASRQLVDAGADLVIGNHPHVLQPVEVYNGVNILYSIGNFCYGGSKSPENRTIIYKVNILVNNEGFKTETEIIPCYVYTGNTNNWQPAVITDETDKKAVLDFMSWSRELPY